MSNYEIMILTNTEMLESDLTKLLTSTLKVKDVKLNKLERNELVYPIKNKLELIIMLVIWPIINSWIN